MMLLAEEQGFLACAPEGCGQYEFIQPGWATCYLISFQSSSAFATGDITSSEKSETWDRSFARITDHCSWRQRSGE